MINKSELWSAAHVNQRLLRETMDYSRGDEDSDLGWLHYLETESPNGELLRRNVLYDTAAGKKVYLAHVTKSFKSIQESGRILSSSGCLVGSVYCTPVLKEKNRLRMHNLGKYILSEEAPKFSCDRKDVALLLIELDLGRSVPDAPTGIDYLKLGPVHFSVFSELNYLLSRDELVDLKQATVTAVRNGSDLLRIVEEVPAEYLSGNFSKFYDLYLQTIPHLPILGYLLFEVLCEYIALFQKGEETERCKALGELYCANFKNLIFSACPDLTRSFNLGLFRPKFSNLLVYLDRIGVVNGDSRAFFEGYLARRLSYLIRKRFYNGGDAATRKDFWRDIEWDFSYLQKELVPLLGHVIHRLLRNMHRYPNFYFYFDQYKALQAWNYWNHANVALPYNAVLPKGEIGINPANPYMKYRVFTAKTWQENGNAYIEADRPISLAIEPRLAELGMLLMRKK
ncbi:MAG: hypothetical protein UY99_C0007G0019 [Parcubacteria group bacterium GW2011_GWA1_59_11]|nr:MAG: hypothetical protein UY99_C0007G0019 [Parcubacteria group bacterium GW2011_GWA1_59_11]